jgi:hypothetical protein
MGVTPALTLTPVNLKSGNSPGPSSHLDCVVRRCASKRVIATGVEGQRCDRRLVAPERLLVLPTLHVPPLQAQSEAVNVRRHLTQMGAATVQLLSLKCSGLVAAEALVRQDGAESDGNCCTKIRCCSRLVTSKSTGRRL